MARTTLIRDQRIQDAIHGIIDFHPDIRAERTAWRLLQTPDFQRLRRIQQLGAAEFVFPSATHSRFAHSIGVFHNARKLVERIRRAFETGRTQGDFDHERADTTILAALLHDIGHGPFSHVFEAAREDVAKRLGMPPPRAHETYSAAMITTGDIRDILQDEGFDADEIAAIICERPPRDMYHAIVSGTFDADRLDYMMRDRYMTGVGEGAFDTAWIMDNIRVAPQGDGHILCLAHKALTAAEEFLLARYYLYKDIYYHKTSRGVQCLMRAFFCRLALEVRERDGVVEGLDRHNPLLRFFLEPEPELSVYRDLDDMIVWGALHGVAARRENITSPLGDLARRILQRHIPACLDVTRRLPDASEQEAFKQKMSEAFGDSIGESVFFDSCPLTLYQEVGDDATQQHSSLMFQLPNAGLREITSLPDSILATLKPAEKLERYYFLNSEDYEQAKKMMGNP